MIWHLYDKCFSSPISFNPNNNLSMFTYLTIQQIVFEHLLFAWHWAYGNVPDKHSFISLFADEKIGLGNLSNLPEIIRLLCDKTVSGTVVSTCHPNCSGT
jgi:hypothetical protein